MSQVPGSSCTAAALVTGCFNTEIFNPKQQLALITYLLALQLEAVGGTDYTSDLKGLINDAAQVFQTMTEDQRMEALISILIQEAVSAGAEPPSSTQAVLQEIQCLACGASEDQIIQCILWLLCNLGPHAVQRPPIG